MAALSTRGLQLPSYLRPYLIFTLFLLPKFRLSLAVLAGVYFAV